MLARAMMVLSRPSASPYLSRSLFALNVPVFIADAHAVPMRPALQVLGADELRNHPRRAYQSLLLTSSENALAFLYEALPHDDRVLKSRLFKDKAAFRRATESLVEGFTYREMTLDELRTVRPESLTYPLVLKPSVGISSIGVIRVADASAFVDAARFVESDLAQYTQNYRSHVVHGTRILLESWIEGRELAIDGFFDADAEPVVLNILEHLFANNDDTSDRVYATRKSLVERFLDPVLAFLRKFGDTFDLKRFPFHLELRFTPDGRFVPIELNPLRFAGLGTTEIAEYAYGINVYEYFFRQRAPDWKAILSRDDDSVYSFACLDVPTPRFREPGLEIRDRTLFGQFLEVLDYRMLDERETSTFAVIFFRSPDLEEPTRVLSLDLDPFFSPTRA